MEKSSKKEKSKIAEAWPRARHFLAGYASGCALVLSGHPFDTIKVRMQTETSGRFKGPIDCLLQTIRKEGMLSVYKGVLPPLIATGCINSIMFGIQGWMVHSLATRNNRPEHLGPQPTIGEICFAAVGSGLCISLLVSPMEGVKARLQVNYGQRRGVFSAIRDIVATTGIRRGLYRGWAPTALCRMSNYAYFGSYELIRRQINTDDGSGKRALGPSVVAGGLTGLCYWLSCYPMDVIKNRIQAAPDVQPPVYSGIRDAARTIYAEGGVKSFFRGFTPCVLRAFPANASCFLAFEAVMNVLPQEIG